MKDLEAMHEKAINDRLREECILVTLRWTDRDSERTPKLMFKIDHREVEQWKKQLLEKGERFSMVDTRNGELMFETHWLTEETK